MKPRHHHKGADELRLSSKEFDRIMRRALQVQPEEARKQAKNVKMKVASKK